MLYGTREHPLFVLLWNKRNRCYKLYFNPLHDDIQKDRMNYLQIEETINSLELKYNFTLGWRFLNTKIENISNNNGVFIITLNPGVGKGNFANHNYKLSNENGNSLLHEEWKSPLANQLKLMLEKLRIGFKHNITNETFIEQILQGYYLPFRSKSIEDLLLNPELIKPSDLIWTSILKNNLENLKIICCIGKDIPYKNIKNILSNLNLEEISKNTFKTGWGNITVDITKYRFKNKFINLIGFPHLSQFKIFGRAQAETEINNIINNLCN